MARSYEKLVCEYVFSNKEVKDFPEQDQLLIKMAKDILTTHGMGGKFMEKLLQYKFKLEDDEGIHGWDAWTEDKSPVEIKTETVNATKKIFCEASYPAHTKNKPLKSEVYKNHKPVLVSAGLCAKTGKCIYVMFTETGKIDSQSKFFKRLSAPAPRINFGHFKESVKAYKVVYKNRDVILDNIDEIHPKFKDVLIGLPS